MALQKRFTHYCDAYNAVNSDLKALLDKAAGDRKIVVCDIDIPDSPIVCKYKTVNILGVGKFKIENPYQEDEFAMTAVCIENGYFPKMDLNASDMWIEVTRIPPDEISWKSVSIYEWGLTRGLIGGESKGVRAIQSLIDDLKAPAMIDFCA